MFPAGTGIFVTLASTVTFDDLQQIIRSCRIVHLVGLHDVATTVFFVYPSPIYLDPVHVPAKHVLIGRHAYGEIVKHHMLVADAPVGCSWSCSQLFC